MLFHRDRILTGSPEDGLALLALVALVYLWVQFRSWVPAEKPEIYDAKLAWLRAGMYFAACFLVSWATGVLSTLWTQPLIPMERVHEPRWLALTLGALAVELIAYWYIWPLGTFTQDRPQKLSLQVPYGIVWGLCQGQMFLAFWALAEMAGFSTTITALITFTALSGFQGAFHSQYWDIWVSPEHNIESWNKWKVLCCHVPNLIITLTHLSLFGNAGMFVLFQTVSLLGSAIFMRFPPPSSRPVTRTIPPPGAPSAA